MSTRPSRTASVEAGIELRSFASHVVAEPGTTFGLAEIGRGLIPGAGGTVSFTRRIGRGRRCTWPCEGAPIDAVQAWSWGLVDEIG